MDKINSLSIEKAFSLHLSSLNQSVITKYQLASFLFNLYKQKKYQNHPLKIYRKVPSLRILNTLIKKLVDESGILIEKKWLPSRAVFMVFGKTEFSPEEVICSINPFAYLSHMSAMAYHGLTNRIPNTLYFSGPGPRDWKKFALQKMEKDLGEYFDEYISCDMPILSNIRINKIKNRPMHFHSSVHWGAYISPKGKTLRVSSIGRTFLDMVREPSLCGGINHVMDVYQEEAETYLGLILDEFEQNGNLIEKTRAGYILDERCHIKNKTLDRWAKSVQRGGSRKLDPHGDYSPSYSKKWCLSLNND